MQFARAVGHHTASVAKVFIELIVKMAPYLVVALGVIMVLVMLHVLKVDIADEAGAILALHVHLQPRRLEAHARRPLPIVIGVAREGAIHACKMRVHPLR